VRRLAPILGMPPEPIDGWLEHPPVSASSPLPCACYVRITTIAPLSPLRPLRSLPSPLPLTETSETSRAEGHVTADPRVPIPVSDPDTGLPPVGAIIRIGVPSAILDQGPTLERC